MSELRLPPGLDPVTAGRLGLWLLGQRSHRRSLRRRYHHRRVFGVGLANRAVKLIAPWTIAEYPGWERALAEICSVKVSTSRKWYHDTDALPRKHALTLAAICESRAAEFSALAEELRAHAATVPERRPPRRRADPV